MQSYKIIIHNLLNKQFNPTVVPARNLFHMLWRCWKIINVLIQLYDIIPGSKFGIIDSDSHEVELDKNYIMYGWNDGKIITPVVIIELEYTE